MVILLTWLALLMITENSYGNNTGSLRNNFKKVKEQGYFVHGLGLSRFEKLRVALHPSITEIRELIDILLAATREYVLLKSKLI